MTVRSGTIERMATDLALALERAADEIDAHDGADIENHILMEGAIAAREFSSDLNSGELLTAVLTALRGMKQ